MCPFKTWYAKVPFQVELYCLSFLWHQRSKALHSHHFVHSLLVCMSSCHALLFAGDTHILWIHCLTLCHHFSHLYFLWQDLSVDTKIFDFVTLTLTFDLLLKKLNLDHNFWSKSYRALILHISVPCDKTFLLMPIFLTKWPWPWLLPTFGKTWICCRGGY